MNFGTAMMLGGGVVWLVCVIAMFYYSFVGMQDITRWNKENSNFWIKTMWGAWAFWTVGTMFD